MSYTKHLRMLKMRADILYYGKNTEGIMKPMECEVKKQESKSFVKKELNEIKDGKKGKQKKQSVYDRSK